MAGSTPLGRDSSSDGARKVRSLTEDLRQRDDIQLAALLRARTDLLHPVPAGFGALANRATTVRSLTEVLDGLDLWSLQVLQAYAALDGPAAPVELAARLPGVERGDLETAAALLHERALLWDGPQEYRVVNAVRQLLGGAAPVRGAAAEPLAHPQPHPPAVGAVASEPPARVARHAGGQAASFVRNATDLLTAWSSAPPRRLRAGGLGVRDLARTATALGQDQQVTALLVEVVNAAQLLGNEVGSAAAWCPTPRFDTWRTLPLAEQWAELARAWFEMAAVPALLGTEPRPNLLTWDVRRAGATDVRRAVLEALRRLPEGTAPDREQLAAHLAWHHPRRESALQRLLYDATLDEAELLGVTGLGALADTGRALLTTDPRQEAGADPVGAALVRAVEPLLPVPVDHVLLQADGTAVAPGPLVPDLAADLALLADVESTGGATVYRFTETSVRRALDAGWSAARVLAVLRERSRTPVPQPLEYLVTDLGNRHGRVRVGPAASYVRCDDPGTVASLLADRATRALGLVRIADTVLVSAAAPSLLMSTLREGGYLPAEESTDGVPVAQRPAAHRSPLRGVPGAAPAEPGPPAGEVVDAAVRALRAGDVTVGERITGGSGGSGRLPRSTSSETLAVLHDAVAAEQEVWIGYADRAGLTTERVVEPLRLEAGFLTAYDVRTAQVRTFTLARITAVLPITTR